MKDSQQRRGIRTNNHKYIKANNERFSTLRLMVLTRQ